MVSTITREELRGKIVRGDKFHLIEVECEGEGGRDHIPGSLRLAAEEVTEQAAEILPNKVAEVVLYCQHGGCACAGRVAEELTSAGYTSVSHYNEGAEGWVGAGYPVEHYNPPSHP